MNHDESCIPKTDANQKPKGSSVSMDGSSVWTDEQIHLSIRSGQKGSLDTAKDAETSDSGQSLVFLERRLEALRDEKKKKFFCRLSPHVDPNRVLGVPVPVLEKMAEQLSAKEAAALFQAPSRKYYEEDMMLVKRINRAETMEAAWRGVERLLPHLNTWSLTDGLTLPRVPSQPLLEKAVLLLDHCDSHAKRLGILWIMKRAIHPQLYPDLIRRALEVPDDSREVQMAKGWLLCEGMIGEPEWFWPVIQNLSDSVVQQMAIGKCLDSRRISAAQKEMLRALRHTIRANKKRR